jgi:DNA-binding CsgD family transcriptional regulator
VLSLIRQLQTGTINGSALSPSNRRLCVEHLTSEGYTVPEIAQILSISDRSVKRDRMAIRQAHAVEMTPEFIAAMAGMLVMEASTCTGRIRRAVRASDVDAQVKVEAERSVWTITRELISSLQRLGYLPSAPQVFQGHLLHQVEDAPEHQQIESELARLESVILEAGNPRLKDQLDEVRQIVTRIGVNQQVRQLSAAVHAAELSSQLIEEGGV